MDSTATLQSGTMRCACGAAVSAGAKFCESCGAPLSPRRCRCGSQLSATARFCSACGARVGAEMPQGAPPSSSSPSAGEAQGRASALLLVSAPPWEQDSGTLGTSTAALGSSFTPAPTPTPAPIIGHWKMSVKEFSAFSEAGMKMADAEARGGSMVQEKEYIFAPDGTLSGVARYQAQAPMGFALVIASEETGTWKYSAGGQRLEVSSNAEYRVDDAEMGGFVDSDAIKQHMQRQLAQTIKTKEVFQIERGDARSFEARDTNDTLWRFDRLE